MPRKIWPPALKAPQPGRGFSLVEVIFAASLLSLVMLMMFNLYPSSLLTIRQAEHRLQATAKAQAILEQDRAGSFTVLQSATASPTQALFVLTPTPTCTGYDNGTKSYVVADGNDNGTYYLAERTVATPTPEGATPRLLSDTVTVYWNERQDNPTIAGTSYRNWHSMTQELWICDIQH